MKVFIYGQYWKADDAPHVNGLITQLKSHGADLCIYQPYLEKAHLASNNHTMASNYDDLKAVANQFEAIFLEMLLKQARESKLSDGLFDTDADDNFVQMFDAELAKSSSELVDIGIAEAIIEQMTPRGSRS